MAGQLAGDAGSRSGRGQAAARSRSSPTRERGGGLAGSKTLNGS